MEPESINITITIIGLISGAIAAYAGLKQRAMKSDLESNLLSKEDYKADKDAEKKDLDALEERLRDAERKIDVIKDRTNAIFKQMDKQSEQIEKILSKFEDNINNSFQDVKGMIRELYQTKQDKNP